MLCTKQAIHDSAVDIRIRLEQLLNTARGFPSAEGRKGISAWQNGPVEPCIEALESLAGSVRSAVQLCVPDNVDSASDATFSAWRDSILDRWGRKVNEAEGVTPKGGFKAIDTSVSAQLRATLATGKHLQRCKRVRAPLQLHGDAGELPVGTDDMHYDDGELYRSILQEIIESGEGVGGGLRYAQLTKSRKVRKKVDRSASKARKPRYVVHDKLVGFLAPVPLPDPGPLDEIIAGMFGANGASR